MVRGWQSIRCKYLPCSYIFLYLLMAAAGYRKCSQGEFWSVILCLVLCSFSLRTSSLVEKLASRWHATIYSHHLNLLVIGLEKHRSVHTFLFNTIFFLLTPSDYFLNQINLPGSLCQLFSIFDVDSVVPVCLSYLLINTAVSNTAVPQRFPLCCPFFAFPLQLPKHEPIPQHFPNIQRSLLSSLYNLRLLEAAYF